MTIMEFSEKLHEFCGKQDDCEYCPLFHVSCYTDLTKEGIKKAAKIISPSTYRDGDLCSDCWNEGMKL